MNIVFYFWISRNYFSLISSKVYCHMHFICADFDQKMEQVILVNNYDLFLLNSGGPDDTAVRSKKSRLTYVIFHISIGISTLYLEFETKMDARHSFW